MVIKMLVDPHVHTSVGSICSRISPQQLISMARKRGIDVLCVTDHECYSGIKETQDAAEKEGILTIRGIEKGTEYGHIVFYGVDIYELPSIERDKLVGKVQLDELIDWVHARSGAVVLPHPFGMCDSEQSTMRYYAQQYRYFDRRSSKNNNKAYTLENEVKQIINFVQNRDPIMWNILQKIDGIEVLNSTCSIVDNWAAYLLAEYLGKNMLGCSDAHYIEQVGLYATVFPLKIKCERDFIQYLRYGTGIKPKINVMPDIFESV